MRRNREAGAINSAVRGGIDVPKRIYAVIGLILLCLTGCMVTTRLDLPAWKAFRQEMLARDYITQLEAEQGPADRRG